MQSQSLGTVEFGQILSFAVSDRLTTGAAASWDPAVFDVFDCRDGSLVLSNQTLFHETDRDIWFGTVDTAQSSTEIGEALHLGNYAVVVKPDTSENPSNFALYNFTITGSYSDRLKRVLGLLGENLVLDNFSHDSAGNCTGFRIRLFGTRAGADAASIGITDVPEPDEIATYNVTQTFVGSRRLRISHVSLIDDDREEA
jgi:hypothetical protein